MRPDVHITRYIGNTAYDPEVKYTASSGSTSLLYGSLSVTMMSNAFRPIRQSFVALTSSDGSFGGYANDAGYVLLSDVREGTYDVIVKHGTSVFYTGKQDILPTTTILDIGDIPSSQLSFFPSSTTLKVFPADKNAKVFF